MFAAHFGHEVSNCFGRCPFAAPRGRGRFGHALPVALELALTDLRASLKRFLSACRLLPTCSNPKPVGFGQRRNLISREKPVLAVRYPSPFNASLQAAP